MATDINQAVNIVDQLHMALRNLMMSDTSDVEERRALIAPTLTQLFDFDAMTKAIAGSRNWRSADDETKNAAIAAFRNWTIGQYAARFTPARAPDFSTRSTRDGGRGTLIVESVLSTTSKQVGLDYRVATRDDGARIIDIYLDGRISEVALRKSEFSQTVRSGGVAALGAALAAKSADLATTGG